ncbi:hypothetical protein AJ88_20995 [Mesorhizobium amorphae CCBAU 01583]|nr:hypothetical protein AJ88_20995 [Mesorhizobium amorphae CCBAU 01583]
MLEAEADKGNVALQKRLAQAYTSGELGVKNAEKAARWYLRAASRAMLMPTTSMLFSSSMDMLKQAK